jgi:hypothetical protein
MSDTIIEPTGGSQEGTQTATPTPAPSGSDQTAAPPSGGAKPTEPAKPVGSVLTDDGADPPVAAAADWPADWRERMAGDDKAFLNTLKRYASPLTYAKAGFEAQQKIRSGEAKKPIGPDASPEEIAAFRKENGIPESPAEYKVELADGMVPGEADKPLLDGFKEFAHGKNYTPAQLNDVLNWYYSQQDAISAQRLEADLTIKTATEEALRSEWGAEYRSNVNAIKNYLSGLPQGVGAAIVEARAPDGTPLGNHPEVVRWLAAVARDAMPGAGLVPAGTSNPSAAIETEIETIRSLMQAGDPKYWKDDKMQARYRELISAQQRARAR